MLQLIKFSQINFFRSNVLKNFIFKSIIYIYIKFIIKKIKATLQEYWVLINSNLLLYLEIIAPVIIRLL